MAEHKLGQSYSEAYTVPTVQRFEQERHKRNASGDSDQFSSSSSFNSDKQLPATPSSDSGSSPLVPGSKKDVMARMTGPIRKPTEKVRKKKGERTVKDPTTGLDVVIKDADFKDYPNIASLDPHSDVQGPATEAPSIHVSHSDDPRLTAPVPSKPGNISLLPFPPPPPISLAPTLALLDQLQIAIVASSVVLWFFLAFGNGFWKFFFRSVLIGGVGFGVTSMTSIAQRKLEKEVERVRVDMHRARGEKYAPPTPESVEWLNAFIKTFWGLVNPDMFISIVDMVEDIMQQSLPKFVDAVRISGIGQGTNPFRIVSMRALPDTPEDQEYPREEWIDQGTNQLMTEREKAVEEGKDADQSGDYVNFEVAFAYQALPGQGDKLRAKNIHLLLEFFLGIYDWLHIPIPIWIQVEGVVGTMRARVQFIPEAPFVRNVTFTFMGVPAIEVSAKPMMSKMPNVLDLPLISRFVKMAIAAGTAEFVAPKSMTLNIQEMLNAAVIGDTRAIGVFMVKIHYAEDLSAQDSNGRSDPYIVLAYAKFGKPQYSTRIIIGELNPVYEETAFLMLTEDEVKADEDLSAMLWDSDKRSADDLIGRIQIPIKELMARPNEMIRRSDKLMGYENADAMQGTLHWSIGYYEKVPLNKQLELPPPVEEAQNAPKTAVQKEMRPNDQAPNPAAQSLPPPPPDVRRTPPDPQYPSGVLSVVVHQINNLERQNLKGTTGGEREGVAGQDTDEPSEQGGNLPSSYCEIVLNDDLIYKTRVKQYTSMPYFEAGTETFIRDYRKAIVRIVVRDARLREKDPILGIVSLNLVDLFSEASEVTRLYSLQEGIGFGRVNVTLLFRSFKVKLDEANLGWDTCTVELVSPVSMQFNSNAPASIVDTAKRLIISTTDSTEKIPSSEASVGDDGRSLTWDLELMRLPTYNRHATSLTFELSKSRGPLSTIRSNQPMALAVLWLKDLEDDKTKDVELPIVIGKDLRQLRQNTLGDFTKRTHEYEVIGTLRTKIKIDSGLDMDHEVHAQSQARRHAFETYDHWEGEAAVAERNAHFADDGVIDKKEQKAIERARKRQLHNRHRGIAGFRPYRTLVWMKQGVKSRILPGHADSKREPAVKSEAQTY